MITLALDASTYTGTAAVLRDGLLLGESSTAMRGQDREGLLPAVHDLLASVKLEPRALDRIVCGAGPGSFTSLRIAGSIAKGLALGLDRPLYGVSSLALIVAGSANTPPGRYVAVLDALRGESFVAECTVDDDGEVRQHVAPYLAQSTDIDRIAGERSATAIGPKQLLVAAPHARGVRRLERSLDEAGAVSLDSWEPDYGRKAEAQVRWEALHGQPLPRE